MARSASSQGARAFFFRDFLEGHLIRQRLTAVPVLRQKQPQEASEFIRMEERGKPLSSNLFVVPDERRVSFQPLCQGTSMSTKSFIISLPIITGDQDRRRLRKSFSFGCNLQNAVMGGGWDRVLKMRATAEWQTARAMPKSSERTKAFRDLRVRFRLNEYDFHADVAKHRKALGRGHLLGINECQSSLRERGSRWNATSTTAALRGSSASTRTAFDRREDQSHRHHLESRSAVRNRLQARVPCTLTSATIRHRALQDPTDPTKPRKVKYCRIVREMRKGKERFLLQLVSEGTSPLKHAYAGKDLRMAIDPGLGSLTYATEDGTIAKVQIAPSADTGSPCRAQASACDGAQPPSDESRQLRNS